MQNREKVDRKNISMSKGVFCATQEALKLFSSLSASFLYFTLPTFSDILCFTLILIPIGASSLLHQLKSGPLFKKISHKLNSSLEHHGRLSHHNSNNNNGYTVHVESEEIIIVSIVLIFWMIFIIMFIKKWGRIRHLEPCSFVPVSSKCGGPHGGIHFDSSNLISSNLMSSPKLHSLRGSSYHNNLNLSTTANALGNCSSRKSSFNHQTTSISSPSAINPVSVDCNEGHLSVPGNGYERNNTDLRSRSVSPDNVPFPFHSRRNSPFGIHSPYTSTHSSMGQTSCKYNHSPMMTSARDQWSFIANNARGHSLPCNSRFRKKNELDIQERKSSDPGQIVVTESEQETNNNPEKQLDSSQMAEKAVVGQSEVFSSSSSLKLSFSSSSESTNETSRKSSSTIDRKGNVTKSKRGSKVVTENSRLVGNQELPNEFKQGVNDGLSREENTKEVVGRNNDDEMQITLKREEREMRLTREERKNDDEEGNVEPLIVKCSKVLYQGNVS